MATCAAGKRCTRRVANTVTVYKPAASNARATPHTAWLVECAASAITMPTAGLPSPLVSTTPPKASSIHGSWCQRSRSPPKAAASTSKKGCTW